MAIITPSTFDPLRRFIAVRLQQGVPLVDADWNEMDDMRRFGLRSHLRWFVGNGIPEGSDAFRLAARAVPVANEVDVFAGVPVAPLGTPNVIVGLRHVGRCLVEGIEALIDADLTFRSQDLHVAVPGSAALAVLRGVPQIAEMPVLNGTVCLYLDVWERLIRPDEMPVLVFADLGTESCARVRAEWAVRARVGIVAPQPGDADFIAGHFYYPLSLVTRLAADPLVYPGQVTDLREKRLFMPPAHLIEDLFGTAPDAYRRGQGRPVLPLRDVMNALLRGELPSTPDQVIAPDPANDFATRAIVAGAGNTVVAFHSTRVGGTPKVFITTWQDAQPGDGAGPLDTIRYRRRQYDATWTEAAAVWLEADTVDLSATQPNTSLAEPWVFHGAIDAVGRIMVAFRTFTDDIAVARLTPATGAIDNWPVLNSGTVDREPFVLNDGAARVWVFFRADGGIFQAVLDLATNIWTVPALVPGTSDGPVGANQRPAALFDADGGLWLFWSRLAAGPKTDIWTVYRNPTTLAWGAPRQVSGSPGSNDFPVAFERNGALQLYFRSNRAGNFDLFFKTLITRI